ncbi:MULTISPECIES: MarR family winged helix-turn-helix transcriptional regulator [Leclercia]|jgi:MarR family transcriptional regulator, organic hydroperoxide resistance regulator|uniref:MarR family transcriptional regulator n=1 Tax=Leclercia pneumoniae TaxID=2815358 RepID=A0ABX8JV70_9ENTR|nr:MULTISPECIES: MarR family transcriptional regulator [Leclercia]KKY86507.1 MarR family transcriptional regulator [Enterobacter cloacae]MBM6607208.1 MarR family transcriptional regulator [Enterobacteriaceae bacterium RIT 814]MBS0851228.1 MarR family transcriptional regulator [Enterobacter sp. JGM127]MCV2511444.1 MarR family transcriptional regulator [Leclercia pneumoniae]QSW34886.1 MarR family transcriptional regulator [Leclercia pneumoniae]
MKENKTLDGLLCFSLYSVTNALIRQYRPLLNELDLTYPQFVVLMALFEQDNIPLRDLSEKTLFDSGTLTPLVQKLEAKGFLKRVAVVGDERMKNVVLTEKADALKAQIMGLPDQMRCSMRMNDEELATLRQLARNLLEDL